jgi:hypothetical protein
VINQKVQLRQQRQIGILWPTENVDFIIEINKKGI